MNVSQDAQDAPPWFRIDTFINGVGDWWMTATDIETGRVMKAEGDKTASRPRARRVLIDSLWTLRRGSR